MSVISLVFYVLALVMAFMLLHVAGIEEPKRKILKFLFWGAAVLALLLDLGIFGHYPPVWGGDKP